MLVAFALIHALRFLHRGKCDLSISVYIICYIYISYYRYIFHRLNWEIFLIWLARELFLIWGFLLNAKFLHNIIFCLVKNARILNFVYSIVFAFVISGKMFVENVSIIPRCPAQKFHYRAQSRVRDNFEICKNYDVHGLSRTIARWSTNCRQIEFDRHVFGPQLLRQSNWLVLLSALTATDFRPTTGAPRERNNYRYHAYLQRA